MDKKKYIDVLTEQASKHSRPQEMALSDFCDYLIEFFSIDAFKAGTTEYRQHVLSCTKQNPDFAGLTSSGSTMWQQRWSVASGWTCSAYCTKKCI